MNLITLAEFVKPQFTRGFKDEYVTFTIPECSKGIDEYLNMRIRYGEKLTQDSFLIREQFDLRPVFDIKMSANKATNNIQVIDRSCSACRIKTERSFSGDRKKTKMR
jgi:hypothetical protein